MEISVKATMCDACGIEFQEGDEYYAIPELNNGAPLCTDCIEQYRHIAG